MNENYPIFIHWQNTLDWILDRTERFPKKVRFTLSDRMANLALDVQLQIVEAIYTRDRRTILDAINLNLEKLRVLFRICHERRLIADNQYAYIAEAIDEAGRMVGGWRRP